MSRLPAEHEDNSTSNSVSATNDFRSTNVFGQETVQENFRGETVYKRPSWLQVLKLSITEMLNFNAFQRRREYWIFYFWMFFITFALSLAVVFLYFTFVIGWNQVATLSANGTNSQEVAKDIMQTGSFASAITLFVSLTMQFATISTSIRRLHDIGLSGWYYLLVLVISYIFPFVFIILGLIPSKFNNNPYRTQPLFQEDLNSLR